jgi:hypothetical protein
MKKFTLIALILIILAGVIYFAISSRPTASSLGDFADIKVGTPYADIEKRFGPPEKDIGSGIHIFVYTLPDKSEIMLGFADLNSLLYAKHRLNDGTVVDVGEK